MAHLTRPAEISGVSASLFPETAAGNRAYFTIYLEVYLGRGGIFDCVSAYPRIHFTIYLEVYLGRGGIFDCVSAYPRIHFTIYLEVYLGRGGIFDCVSAYPRIHFTIYLEVYLGRSGIFDCVSAYPRIHFTIYLEVYLGRGGILDCVSAYPAFSEVQLQNGRVFCSYSNYFHEQHLKVPAIRIFFEICENLKTRLKCGFLFDKLSKICCENKATVKSLNEFNWHQT